MATLPAQLHPACYPSDPAKALDFLTRAFALGTDLPPAPNGSRLPGIVAPHIDFRVSLPAYAAAFRPLLDEPLAENYLILGVGHRSRLEWNLDRRDYLTPLGPATCANDLIDLLADGVDPKRLFGPSAHEAENSIEFALVWLQTLHRIHPAATKQDWPVRFVPLLCGGLHHYVDGAAGWDDLTFFHHVARALANVFEKFPPGEKLRIIVSIDGCHMGPRFQHPFHVTPKLLKQTAAWEERLWAAAAPGDVRTFLDWFRAEGNERYFDGVGALALLMAAAGLAGTLFGIQRTYYEQWFTEADHSVVTFSAGRVLG